MNTSLFFHNSFFSMDFHCVFTFSHRMLRPEELQRDLDDYNRPVQQQNRSIDDCLDTTDALVQWAQRKAPQYDPENRRPIPVCIQRAFAFLFSIKSFFLISRVSIFKSYDLGSKR